ncbi:7-alpha-hydroxycholest-4-en-3-one 12-alpha-hydroxylase [Fusarium austroafricanum]|uniref:7-alpha-hydroxycholest-4-en-3-one 12-alpha-hydroxylase n=1 Tax=Fusarium austroafricanum TaxID=2364996 RepID=A0A8H4NQK9_9HYPO|nr:7-alpha-hydroxycholest-4-en-3-one 12-alpha-hydroxylase [Fusarium austroafricanum]
MLLDNDFTSVTWVIFISTGLILLISRFVSPQIDPFEPPVLKPRVPLIGHIISTFREGTSFYARLFKEHRLPICTLPMLNGKIYVINSPDLIQAALRNNDISFDPFLIEFSKAMWGLSKNAVGLISNDDYLKEGLSLIHSSLTGEPLYELNISALTCLMSYLNRIQVLRKPDVFDWLRDILTDASATALFGEKNTLTVEHSHLLWTFDEQAVLIAIGVPSLITRKALNARREVNRVLLPYYQNGGIYGEGVSALIRKRAIFLRSTGLTADDLSQIEMMLPWVGVTNTAPTLFWVFMHVFTNTSYLSRVRAEVEAITVITTGAEGRTATFDIKDLETCCPFLNACYQECLRFYLHSVGNRRVMKDTMIQDSEGRKYLLQKGWNIQWAPSVTHFIDEIWGSDAASFKPERFLDVTVQEEKRRRGALLSFGGGKNLCPGRKIAFAEIVGFVGVVSLTFEVEGLSLPNSSDPRVGEGPRKPDWGSMDSGFRMTRREGWEDVTWVFKE